MGRFEGESGADIHMKTDLNLESDPVFAPKTTVTSQKIEVRRGTTKGRVT